MGFIYSWGNVNRVFFSVTILKTEKTFQNEQRSKDAAAKKDLIQVE